MMSTPLNISLGTLVNFKYPRGESRCGRWIVLATAFVLINAEIGAENDVLKDLKAIQEVKEAHMVYGVYDIIARVETETMQELKDTISWKIRRLDKVRSTLTMIVV
jgi:DNA-binding Lrp family transcriptional regulator